MALSVSLARNLRVAFGVALIVAGLLHGSAYGAVVPLVRDVGNDARVILPALWVGFGWHYVALGLIVLFAGGGQRLLWLVTLIALVDALTQMKYFGYSPSEMILLVVAVSGAAAAWAHRRAPETVST